MKTKVVDVYELIESIPYDLKFNDKVRGKVVDYYESIVPRLVTIGQRAENEEGKQVEVVFQKFVDGQAFFCVTDTNKTIKNEYNWYGQNTSQWLFAGCIQVTEDGYVSMHT